MFDFLLLLVVLYSAVIPALQCGNVNFEPLPAAKTFAVFAPFIYMLFFVDYYWHARYLEKYTIINFNTYLNEIKDIKIDFVAKIIILLYLFLVIIKFLPEMSHIIVIEGWKDRSYAETTSSMIIKALTIMLSPILWLTICLDIREKRVNPLNLVLLTLFLITIIFGERRNMLFQFVLFILFMYSINRDYFTKKTAVIIILGVLFIFKFYFPLFNVIRHNNIEFNRDAPLDYFTDIYQYAQDMWDEKYEKAVETTDSRSLGVYDAVYSIVQRDFKARQGELTNRELESAIPFFLYPNKDKRGATGTLEWLSGRNTDIADSIFLLSYGDYRGFAYLYSFFLYFIVIAVYSTYARIMGKYLNCILMEIFILASLLQFLWNVEGRINSAFSWIFSSFLVLVILYIINKFWVRVEYSDDSDDFEDTEELSN